MLSQLRTSMKRDPKTGLKKMEQLEMEIKNRASGDGGGVEDSATSTQRNRLDSGAFLDHATGTSTASSTAAPSAGAGTATTAH